MEIEKEYIYPAVLASGYDGGRLWAVNFVGLSGCWVEGEEREDVIKRAPDVLREYLKYCAEAGIPFPEPPRIESLKEANVGEVITVRCRI